MKKYPKIQLKVIENPNLTKEEEGQIWVSFWEILDGKFLDNKISDSKKEKSSKN